MGVALRKTVLVGAETIPEILHAGLVNIGGEQGRPVVEGATAKQEHQPG